MRSSIFIVLLFMIARCVTGNTISAVFLNNVFFSPLSVDPLTRMVSCKIGLSIPYDNANVIPFLMVGPNSNLPVPTYTQSTNASRSSTDAIACTPTEVTMNSPAAYSCATLSQNDLQPYACTSGRTPPHAFTALDMQQAFVGVDDHALFFDPIMTSEQQQQQLDAQLSQYTTTQQGASDPTAPFRYDVATDVGGGVLSPLYCGECLFNTSACDHTQAHNRRCPVYDAIKYNPRVNDDATRIHVAKIVPFESIDNDGNLEWHFQYNLNQLAHDCAHKGVKNSFIFEAQSGRTIGTMTEFTLLVGMVYNSFTTIVDMRRYSVSLYTNSLVSSNIALQFLYIAPSKQELELTLCDVPTVSYVNATNGYMVYCFQLTYVNVASDAIVGPRILTDPTTGQQSGDVTTIVVPSTDCHGSIVQSIQPAYDPVRQNAKYFCSSVSNRCTYQIRAHTRIHTLTADGLAFQTCPDDRTSGFGSRYDMMIQTYAHTRGVDGSASDATPMFPPLNPGNYSNYDWLQVTMGKRAYPDTAQNITYSMNLAIFTTNTVARSDLMYVACKSSTNPIYESIASMCDTQQRTPTVSSGSVLSIYAYTNNFMFWNTDYSRTYIDVSSLVFTATIGRVVQNVLTPMTLVVDQTSPGFESVKQCWLYAPRNHTGSGVVHAPLVVTNNGIDSVHMDWLCFFEWLRANRGLQSTDLRYTFFVSLYANFYSHGTVAGRRLLQAQGDLPSSSSIEITSQVAASISFKQLVFSTDGSIGGNTDIDGTYPVGAPCSCVNVTSMTSCINIINNIDGSVETHYYVCTERHDSDSSTESAMQILSIIILVAICFMCVPFVCSRIRRRHQYKRIRNRNKSDLIGNDDDECSIVKIARIDPDYPDTQDSSDPDTDNDQVVHRVSSVGSKTRRLEPTVNGF